MRVSLALSCAAALAASAAPARAGVKDGVDAWSRGDYSRAVAEWQKPAAAGDADAEFNLAQAYKLGKGVSADLKRAEALYRQAADQGHLQAADMLGLVLFQSGRWAEALAWLTASAERGEPRAQYVLGVAHFNGDLVAKDVVRAYALMTRAAASRLEPAKTTLASMDATLPLADRWVAQKDVWYDRTTKLPTKVLLYDANGRVVLLANLSKHKPVEVVNVPQEQWPKVATRYDLFFPDSDTSVMFELDKPMLKNGAVPNDRSFAFPEEGGGANQIISVDEPAPHAQPASPR